jgi:hypothetical protein
MSKKRITYTAAFKAKVALAAQRQDKTISQLAAPQIIVYSKVHPIVISRAGKHNYAITPKPSSKTDEPRRKPTMLTPINSIKKSVVLKSNSIG